MNRCEDFNYDSCVCRDCITCGKREERPSCYRTNIIKNIPNMLLDEMRCNYEKEQEMEENFITTGEARENWDIIISWGKDIKTLEKMGYSELVIKTLKDLGPTNGGYETVQKFLKFNDASITQINNIYETVSFEKSMNQIKEIVNKFDYKDGKPIDKTSLKDSGDRREFETGAVRDMGGGKGRCDLLPASALIGFARFCDDLIIEGSESVEVKEPREAIKEVLFRCFKYLDDFNKTNLYFASYYLMFTIEAEEHDFDITKICEPFPAAVLRLAKHYEAGAKKYGTKFEFNETKEAIEWINKLFAKIAEDLVSITLEIDVETVMKNGLETTIQTMLKDNAKIKENGLNFIRMQNTIIVNLDEKIRILENEINRLKEKLCSDNTDYLRNYIMTYCNSNKIVVRSVEETSMKLVLSSLITIMKPQWQEEYYAAVATTDLDSLKMIVNFYNRLSTISKVTRLILSDGMTKKMMIYDGASGRNWEKGIPISVMLDSSIRHTLKYLDGRTDEDHLIAALWNVLGAIWMLQNRPEMMDLGRKDESFKAEDTIRYEENK